jgi:hypothetical protein
VSRFIPASLPAGPNPFKSRTLAEGTRSNRRAKLIPLARNALAQSRWKFDFSPIPMIPKPKPEPSGCPRCGSDDLTCVGRLDAAGDFTGRIRGALRIRLRAGPPPKLYDSS